MEPARKSIWRRWWMIGILTILFLVILDMAWVGIDRRFPVGPDTTRITAPLVDGYPDYLAAVNQEHGAGVTPENNAAVGLLEIVGVEDNHADWKHAVYKTWGVAEPAGPPLFVDFSAWAKGVGIAPPKGVGAAKFTFDGFEFESDLDVFYDEVKTACKHPWSAKEHPILAKWVQAMESTLARMNEACARPRYFVPLVSEDGRAAGAADFAFMSAALPVSGSMRTLANAAIARAMMRLDAGDVAGFEQDAMTCAKMGHLMAGQPDLIDYLNGMAIDTLAMNAIQAGAVSDKLSGSEASELRQQVEKLGPLISPRQAIDEGERYVFLDAVCSVHRGGNAPAHFRSGLDVLRFGVPFNFSQAMRLGNDFYDWEIKAFDLPDFPRQHAALVALELELDAEKTRGGIYMATHLERALLLVFVPDLTKLHELQTADLVERDLALASLALRTRRSSSEIFPEKISGIPELSGMVDRFTGEPLIYRRKGTGYLLYSVGMDLKDDGGVRGSSESKGDLSVEAAK